MSGANENAGFPNTNTQVVDIRTGRLTPQWHQFFLSLFVRTGGSTGNVINISNSQTFTSDGDDDIAENDGNMPGASIDEADPYVGEQLSFPFLMEEVDVPQVQQTFPLFDDLSEGRPSPGGAHTLLPLTFPSPYTYTADRPMVVYISGGTISKIEVSRGGVIFYNVGVTAGPFPLFIGDQMRLTFTVPPFVFVSFPT